MPAIAGGAPGDDDGDDGDDGDGGDGDGGDGDEPTTLEAMTADRDKWRGLARKHERDSKRNKAAADELAQIKASQQTAEERTATERQQALDRAAAAEAETLRMRVAIRKGVPESLMGRLKGETEEELEADADELLSFLPADNERETPSQSDGTQRRPTPRLRSGGRPASEPVVTDPEKLAAAVPRSRF